MGKSKTQEEFLEAVVKVHGSRYDYTSSVFVHAKEKIIVRCNTHGDFEITPKNHLAGRGCKDCGRIQGDKNRQSTFEDFLSRLPEDYEKRYKVLPRTFTKLTDKITASCEIHGNFEILPSNLIKGQGCAQCAVDATRLTREGFIKRATKTHGDKYNYDSVIYVRAKEKVEIYCKIHEEHFWQRPASHIQGNGCYKCSLTGFDSTKSGSLYVLLDKNHTKVGITNRDIFVRLSQINRTGKDFAQLTSFSSEDGSKIRKLESVILAWLRDNYSNPVEIFDGYTETFVDVEITRLLEYIQGEFDAIH